MQDRSRAAIISAGHAGSTTAYALMLRAIFREIVLIDNDRELAAAEATELSDANVLARPTRIWAGDYADAACAPFEPDGDEPIQYFRQTFYDGSSCSTASPPFYPGC